MDKQKQIEEMAKAIDGIWHTKNTCPFDTKCPYWGGKVRFTCNDCLRANVLIEAGYRKIPENAVVLTEKEYNRYARIENIIKLAKMEKANGYEVKNGKLYYFSNMLGGCEIEFKDLQEICDMANHYNEEFWGLDQRITFWKGKAETIRKETAEKFAEMVMHKINDEFMDYRNEEFSELGRIVNTVCKELTEGGGNG